MRKKSPLRVFVMLALVTVILVGSNNFLIHLSPFSVAPMVARGDDPSSQNVFLNYTFEGLPLNQTPTGWTPNLQTAGYFIVTNETAYSGQNSAKFVDNSSTAVFTAFS